MQEISTFELHVHRKKREFIMSELIKNEVKGRSEKIIHLLCNLKKKLRETEKDSERQTER